VTPAIRGRMELRVCDRCRRLLTLPMLVDDTCWRSIEREWPTHVVPMPARGSIRLDFDLVDIDEDPGVDLVRLES
jgi:hypothetical protein